MVQALEELGDRELEGPDDVMAALKGRLRGNRDRDPPAASAQSSFEGYEAVRAGGDENCRGRRIAAKARSATIRRRVR